MLDDEIRAVVRILKRIMQQEHLSAQGMARRLGFSASHLSMIFAGKRRPGVRFLRAAMARYPEIRQLVHSQFERPPERRRKNAPR
jgi:transcriptional regulator with XRE-family HTH domain